MYCQICGTRNDEEAEHCRRCHQKLLVISGAYTLEDEEAFDRNPDEQFSFDEHLLERISILEEVVRRTGEALRKTLGALYKLEQKILLNQTGIVTLRDLLEDKSVLAREEWSELWESRMEYQLQALEKRERFAAVKDEIAALYRGGERERFGRHLESAELAFLSFEVGAATAELEAAHALDPANHALSFFLGEAFFNEGESDEALAYFQRVLAVKPDHFESLLYAGVLCHERDRDRRAEELLKRAAALEPDAYLPAFSLGAVYAARRQLRPAALYLERAVAADATPQALYLLAGCCYDMGKNTAAIRHLEQAVRLEPAFEEAHHLLGLAYLDRRWHRKALAALRDAQELAPQQLGYRQLIALVTGHERLPEVEAEALDWLRRGEQALYDGRAREALSAFRRALSHDPENPSLLLAYAMASLELGHTRDVEATVDKVLKLDPGERLRASAYATLIETLRFEGRYRESNRVGHLLIAEGASDLSRTVARFEMAINLAEMEELDEALDLARQALETAPDELAHVPLATLGWVHYRRREFPESVDCLSRSHQLGPSARTLTRLGMALLASGDRAEARRVLAEARAASGDRGALQARVIAALKDSARALQEAAADDPE